MSEHLHSMNPGQSLEFKGPIPKYPWTANKHDHIALIAGGTGITPMYQLARAIFKNPEDKTKVTLVFGNVSEEDILLKREFEDLEQQFPLRFRAFYLLDNPLEASDEIGMAVLIAITFLGSALTLYRSEHLGVSAFRDRLSPGWALAADGFAAWVVFAVSLGLTVASVPLLESVAGQTTVSGLFPASINYWPLLVGGAMVGAPTVGAKKCVLKY